MLNWTFEWLNLSGQVHSSKIDNQIENQVTKACSIRWTTLTVTKIEKTNLLQCFYIQTWLILWHGIFYIIKMPSFG